MNDFPISAISVVAWIMTIKIARFGSKAKVHSRQTSNNLDRVYELLRTNLSATALSTS